MFDTTKIGKRIKELRGQTSQDQCAKSLGISRGALSFYENGERKPDAEVIYKMCEYFNVSADYLLGLSDVQSADEDIQTACKVTGLSEKAIKNIRFFTFSFADLADSNCENDYMYEDINNFMTIVKKTSRDTKKIINIFFESNYLHSLILNLTDSINILIEDQIEVSNMVSGQLFKTLYQNDKIKEMLEKETERISRLGYKTALIDIFENLSAFVNDYVKNYNKEVTENGKHNTENE